MFGSDIMEMELKIHDFEGPLDLLLHLIKESKMDIMDIEIESITKQYVSFIEQQERMNLDVSSEYLVLAAELLEIKSKMLLPNHKEEEMVEEEDPREDLVRRLLEYQAYQDITKLLQEKESLRKEIYTKSPSDVHMYMDENTEIHCDVTLDDLIDAFQKYYQRKLDSRPLNTKITMKELSVSKRRMEIKKLLKAKGKISFFELFPVVSKEYIVVTFLAILEMAKNQELKITQKSTFDDIVCEVIS